MSMPSSTNDPTPRNPHRAGTGQGGCIVAGVGDEAAGLAGIEGEGRLADIAAQHGAAVAAADKGRVADIEVDAKAAIDRDLLGPVRPVEISIALQVAERPPSRERQV